MALPQTLNTNEVKNSAGAEVEFNRIGGTDRSVVFAQVSEPPYCPHRLSIKHQEIGEGLKKRRRSVVMVSKTTISTVDNVTPVTSLAYLVLDAPVGAITTMAEPTNVIAELLSFCATTGAGTTVLFDGSGHGSAAALAGSI